MNIMKFVYNSFLRLYLVAFLTQEINKFTISILGGTRRRGVWTVAWNLIKLAVTSLRSRGHISTTITWAWSAGGSQRG